MVRLRPSLLTVFGPTFALVTWSACDGSARLQERFPSVELSLRRTLGDSLSWKMPVHLLVLDSLLLVADGFGDPHVAVVDLTSGRIRRQLGKHGPGPGELLHPQSLARDPANPHKRVRVLRRQG